MSSLQRAELGYRAPRCGYIGSFTVFEVLGSVKNGGERGRGNARKSHCGFWYFSVAPGKQGDDMKLGRVFKLVFWLG